MTNETDFPPIDDEMEVIDSDEAIDVVQNTLESFLEVAHVDSVYGEPIANGDTVMIPSAEVLSFVGFGVGAGYGTGPAEAGNGNAPGGSGGGGGGGGRVLARPVAVIISSPEGVRVEPIVDATKIALAVFTAAGFMAAMVMRMLSPRRALKELRE